MDWITEDLTLKGSGCPGVTQQKRYTQHGSHITRAEAAWVATIVCDQSWGPV